MYKLLLPLFISLIFFAGCKKETTTEIKKDETKVEVKKEEVKKEADIVDTEKKEEAATGFNPLKETALSIEIKDTINADLPEATFKISGKKTDDLSSAQKIEVKMEGNGKNISQLITFDPTETPDEKTLGFVVEDMNFDGYKDIRIQQFLPAGPNTPYLCWIWDKENFTFVQHTELEELTSPVFDAKTKTVKASVRDNAATYYENEYKYMKDILTLVKETQTIIDQVAKKQTITIKELKKDKMQVVKTYTEDFKE